MSKDDMEEIRRKRQLWEQMGIVAQLKRKAALQEEAAKTDGGLSYLRNPKPRATINNRFLKNTITNMQQANVRQEVNELWSSRSNKRTPSPSNTSDYGGQQQLEYDSRKSYKVQDLSHHSQKSRLKRNYSSGASSTSENSISGSGQSSEHSSSQDSIQDRNKKYQKPKGKKQRIDKTMESSKMTSRASLDEQQVRDIQLAQLLSKYEKRGRGIIGSRVDYQEQLDRQNMEEQEARSREKLSQHDLKVEYGTEKAGKKKSKRHKKERKTSSEKAKKKQKRKKKDRRK